MVGKVMSYYHDQLPRRCYVHNIAMMTVVRIIIVTAGACSLLFTLTLRLMIINKTTVRTMFSPATARPPTADLKDHL